MLVQVTNHHTSVKKSFEGTPDQVEKELLRQYSWLNSPNPDHHGDVQALLDHLSTSQAYSARIVTPGNQSPLHKSEGNLGRDDEVVSQMLGLNVKLFAALDAAKFLAGGIPATGENVRRALYEADGDYEEAALMAYGLQANETNRAALKNIQGLAKSLAPDPLPNQTVVAAHPDGQQTAESVQRAFKDSFVLPVQLGGKHSAGSLLARDEQSGDTWLLKPNGGVGPAKGASETPATPAQREAAWWYMADAWGLGQYYPHADLITCDGKEYAALQLLPWGYRGMDKIKAEDPGIVANIFAPYLTGGVLFKWAIMDAVLGSPDSHAGNIMAQEGDVKLIDHGSAFAGYGFDPARDRNSFTPYYLRYSAHGKFSQMPEAMKLKVMPRLNRESDKELGEWLAGLHSTDLDRVLPRYGIDPGPSKERLAKLQVMATQYGASEAVCRFWCET